MKRLSLFDQLQIRFPISARTNVRRSADAGAAAASMSKSGFGGSLLTNMAKVSADAGQPIVTTSSPKTYISKDIFSEGWAGTLLQLLQEQMPLSCCYLAPVPLFQTISCHTWH